jgi:3-phosphoshikimate 1-carboxyvinyltransferase
VIETIGLSPIKRPIHGRIRPPGSKSITNRALICAALAQGNSTLVGALDSEDTQVMVDSLNRLGIVVQVADEGETLLVQGSGGNIPQASADVYRQQRHERTLSYRDGCLRTRPLSTRRYAAYA